MLYDDISTSERLGEHRLGMAMSTRAKRQTLCIGFFDFMKNENGHDTLACFSLTRRTNHDPFLDGRTDGLKSEKRNG